MHRKEMVLFTDKPLNLASHVQLKNITVAYETYGSLNKNSSNAILITHALTGDAHVAKHSDDDQEGWWDDFVGAGKMLDADTYFLICINVLGGCYGSTGPQSFNPETNQPYLLDFPTIHASDMVRVQKELLSQLGIDHLFCVVGGSMGGIQATQWAIDYPDFISGVINLASPLASSPENVGFNHVMRQLILSDPQFKKGRYTEQPPMLAHARMLAMLTYRTDRMLDTQFSMAPLNENTTTTESWHQLFDVESYLNYQGEKFIQRFDALSFLYLTRMIDLFDAVSPNQKSTSIATVRTPYLYIAFKEDQLFKIEQCRFARTILEANNVPVTYHELSSIYGHDAFLIESAKISPLVSQFLAKIKKTSPAS
ncbi:homoserine O-acetyltransferase MetX [Brochothrix thermosphacta]|uniref:Homoserine O-acetyltransferase n=1 Tax=Brochothrix thermosphacta TaxID=2756 RepID=A0A1D2LEF5_BROTH|nr:homoserine O-acetyltransferase [Brochothrix thermosphacta]SLM90273.1 Homoserine O-acetyltransferase [Brachybacterium faecium]ATF26399.1 homoserine O-acetyltransferase [Brochothrix thermosphacta]ATH85739.1 homoserine O-acetyltransferase [Brochothrix thermosphacta]MDO7864407.1 homoserine O-acetyltransferase [Brochothrix thermosphacta]MPQ28786.1 homoserine O-acetyltransferase [Brochothrix thermosphacta]